jgi:hypothetical protein
VIQRCNESSEIVPEWEGGDLVAVGGRAERRMEGKDFAAAI